MASHAYTTTTLLRPEVTKPVGLLSTGPRRQLGPVTVAIQAMRRAAEERIDRDIALLDALDGDPDFEPLLSSIEPYSYQGQQTWSHGARDDRENAECLDCDGEAIAFVPFAIRGSL